MSVEKSDRQWRKEVSEAYEKWISKGEWSHFITINYNIWRSSTSGKKVYDNKTNKFTDGYSYKPYDGDDGRKVFQNLLDNKRIQDRKHNDEYWMADGRKMWEAQRKIEHAKTMIRKWDTKLNQYMFGDHFYKKEKWKGETLRFILFAENIHSNLHFHGVTNVVDTGKYPKKQSKFLTMANEIWYSPPRKKDLTEHNKLSKSLKDRTEAQPIEADKEEYKKKSICPGGQIWIEEIKTDYDLEKIAGYITKQMKYFGNEEGLYLTNDWRA